MNGINAYWNDTLLEAFPPSQGIIRGKLEIVQPLPAIMCGNDVSVHLQKLHIARCKIREWRREDPFSQCSHRQSSHHASNAKFGYLEDQGRIRTCVLENLERGQDMSLGVRAIRW